MWSGLLTFYRIKLICIHEKKRKHFRGKNCATHRLLFYFFPIFFAFKLHLYWNKNKWRRNFSKKFAHWFFLKFENFWSKVRSQVISIQCSKHKFWMHFLWRIIWIVPRHLIVSTYRFAASWIHIYNLLCYHHLYSFFFLEFNNVLKCFSVVWNCVFLSKFQTKNSFSSYNGIPKCNFCHNNSGG